MYVRLEAQSRRILVTESNVLGCFTVGMAVCMKTDSPTETIALVRFFMIGQIISILKVLRANWKLLCKLGLKINYIYRVSKNGNFIR